MKIGILTFHFAHNYGAMLQAYALVSKLNNMGYDAEIIDYRLPYIYNWHERHSLYKLYNIYKEQNSSLLAFLKTIKHLHENYHKPQKWHRFEDFLNNTLKKSERVYNPSQINQKNYDIILCGSDQIWNEKLTGRLSHIYFCENIAAKKKVAYAASNGTSTIAEKELPIFNHLIKNFQSVSVREEGLCKFLNNRGISVKHVLDPIFLLKKEEWNNIAISPNIKDYILTYSFLESDDFFPIAINVAKRLKKKLICLRFDKRRDLPKSIMQYVHGGPREFLGLFSQASFIITNSFHGTAFSILYQKNFICLLPKNGIERMTSLLSCLELKDRIIEKGNLQIIEKDINYDSVNKKLEEEKKKSLLFLKEAIL